MSVETHAVRWAAGESTRECGACRLCCKLVSVHDIETVDGEKHVFAKQAFKWCEHACEGGCALHGPGKPWTCRLFECEWLLGMATEADRPDRSKLVTMITADSVLRTEGLLASVFADRKGLWQRKVGRVLLSNLKAIAQLTAITWVEGFSDLRLVWKRDSDGSWISAQCNPISDFGPQSRPTFVTSERELMNFVLPGALEKGTRGLRDKMIDAVLRMSPEQKRAVAVEVDRVRQLEEGYESA